MSLLVIQSIHSALCTWQSKSRIYDYLSPDMCLVQSFAQFYYLGICLNEEVNGFGFVHSFFIHFLVLKQIKSLVYACTGTGGFKLTHPSESDPG